MPLTSVQEDFLSAIIYNDLDKVNRLLDENPEFDVNFKDDYTGATPLYIAVEKNVLSIVARLLEVPGINLEASKQTPSNWKVNGVIVKSDFATVTALYCAANLGRLDIVRLLLKKGANVHAKASDGCTALWTAAEHGYVEVARTLLENGANTPESLESRWDKNNFTPLMAATMQSSAEMVNLLLQYNANVYAISHTCTKVFQGYSSLSIALVRARSCHRLREDKLSSCFDCFYSILWHLESQCDPSVPLDRLTEDILLFSRHADLLYFFKNKIVALKEGNERAVLEMMLRATATTFYSYSPFYVLVQQVPALKSWMEDYIKTQIAKAVTDRDEATLTLVKLYGKSLDDEFLKAVRSQDIAGVRLTISEEGVSRNGINALPIILNCVMTRPSYIAAAEDEALIQCLIEHGCQVEAWAIELLSSVVIPSHATPQSLIEACYLLTYVRRKMEPEAPFWINLNRLYDRLLPFLVDKHESLLRFINHLIEKERTKPSVLSQNRTDTEDSFIYKLVETLGIGRTVITVDIESLRQTQEAQWFIAIAIHDITAMRTILDDGIITVDTANEKGLTALYAAAEAGRLENVKFLLERNARADIVCRRRVFTDRTALGIAFEKNHIECGIEIVRHMSIADFESHPEYRYVQEYKMKIFAALSHQEEKMLDYLCQTGRAPCALDVICSPLTPAAKKDIKDYIARLISKIVHSERVKRGDIEEFRELTRRYGDYFTADQFKRAAWEMALRDENTYRFAQFAMQLPVVKANAAGVWLSIAHDYCLPLPKLLVRFSKELLDQNPGLLKAAGLDVLWNILPSSYSLEDHMQLVRLLLEENDRLPQEERFDINARHEKRGYTLLFSLFKSHECWQQKAAVQLLIDHGADVVKAAFDYIAVILSADDVDWASVDEKLSIAHRLLKLIKPETELSDAQWNALDNLSKFIKNLPAAEWKEDFLNRVRLDEERQRSILSSPRPMPDVAFFTADLRSFSTKLITLVTPSTLGSAPVVSRLNSLN